MSLGVSKRKNIKGNGPDSESGVTESGGDIQQELVLHEPCNQAAILRPRGEPRRVRAGRGLEREGD